MAGHAGKPFIWSRWACAVWLAGPRVCRGPPSIPCRSAPATDPFNPPSLNREPPATRNRSEPSPLPLPSCREEPKKERFLHVRRRARNQIQRVRKKNKSNNGIGRKKNPPPFCKTRTSHWLFPPTVTALPNSHTPHHTRSPTPAASLMLNPSHSHSRPDSLSPLLHVLSRAAAAESSSPSPPSEHRTRVTTLPRMDTPSPSGRPTTPRRQLQGQRPPRLNVRMESHAIKKPSGAPAQAQGRREQQQQQQQLGTPPREPVIIYDASPKIIHTKPSEFLALVQRLTGPGSGPPPAEAQAQAQDYQMDEPVLGQSFLPPELLLSPSAAMSPAARLATIERSVRPMPATAPEYVDAADGGADDGGLAAVLASIRPGILSPLPSSLPPAAASGLFSPLPFDPSCISWLNELSPILRAASTGTASSGSGGGGGGVTSNGGASRASYYSDPFVPSPRNLLATPTVPSPATCAELFSNLPDL